MIPKIYEINSLVWLREQPWYNPEGPDLADVPDEQIEKWSRRGFTIIWFLGVWTKGSASREICLQNDGMMKGFEKLLEDFSEDDVRGSPFSVAAYKISPDLGKNDTLNRLRGKLNRHGLKLMLDFVPNHLAVDHKWVHEHPERFVQGTEIELQNEPGNYFRPSEDSDVVIAHGRDPYFSGWTDTAQINIANREARQSLIDLLLHVASQCDAVRCDMAMLLKKSVFENTWGDLSVFEYPDKDVPEFWPEAIHTVREHHPDFLFMAEVYWDLEPDLIKMGFDYTYDKTLYDMLLRADGDGIREHLLRTADFHDNMVRFIENHDEERAQEAFNERHRAAATLVTSLPGPHLFHEGQLTGRRKRLPVQLARRPEEEPAEGIQEFYNSLFGIMSNPVFKEGEFHLLGVCRAWADNPTSHAIFTAWRQAGDNSYMFVANIATHQAQAYSQVPTDEWDCAVLEFRDMLSDTVYYRDCEKIRKNGLYLDIAAGACHVFHVRCAPEGTKADA